MQNYFIISYGDFSKSKKLFSYDRYQKHTLPIFKNPEVASEFLEELKLVVPNSDLRLNLCEGYVKLLAILDTLIEYSDVSDVILDPLLQNSSDPAAFRIFENIYSIKSFRDSLLEL